MFQSSFIEKNHQNQECEENCGIRYKNNKCFMHSRATYRAKLIYPSKIIIEKNYDNNFTYDNNKYVLKNMFLFLLYSAIIGLVAT